jgi:hypothetical protein
MKKIIFFIGVLMTIELICSSDILSATLASAPDSINWTTMNTIHSPTARTGHALTLLPDGHVLLFGGKDSTSHALNDTWLFGAELHKKSAAGGFPIPKPTGGSHVLNPEDWTPITPPSSPSEREGHSLVTLPDGRVLLFGGNGNQGFPFNDLHLFEGNEWSQVTPANQSPSERANHIAWFGGEDMFVSSGSGGVNLYNDLWSYNPSSKTWEQLETPPDEISYYAFPMIIGNLVVLVDVHSYFYNGGKLIYYDMDQKKWGQKQLANFPSGERAFYNMVQDNETAYMLGGGIWDDANQKFNYTDEVWKFDYNTLAFSQINSLPYAIFNSKAILNSQSKTVILWGGKLNDNLMFPGDKILIGHLESSPVQVPPISDLPVKLNLMQNYPNPFNPTTTINYSVPKNSFVTIKVYDVLGREVTTLVNEEKRFGNYEIKFDGSNITSGIYFYKMKADNQLETKKFILLK